MTVSSPFVPQIRLYRQWLEQKRGLRFADYEAMRQWSISDLDAFWQSVWDYFDLRSPTPHSAVLADRSMPGATWFPGARVNYARQVLRHADAAHAAGMPAIISHNEASLNHGGAAHMSWPALRRQVASVALYLQHSGVRPGDRVAAYLPNVPQAVVAFLATASIGAIWSICSTDMGVEAVLDRFRQIAPTVLIGCDSVTYGGRTMDRMASLAALRAALPSVRHLLVVEALGADGTTAALPAASERFAVAAARDDTATRGFEPLWVEFDHPLWILYSSGTTGMPKPIVHGHGGIMLHSVVLTNLHNDVGCSYAKNSWGERYHWYSSTGWAMWNIHLGGLLVGTTCCIFDGSPSAPAPDRDGQRPQPDWTTLWRFASGLGVTVFGAGAAFYGACMKAGVALSAAGDLSRVRAIGTTGSPLSADVQRWGTQQFAAIGTRDIWWCNISGGTDFSGAFIGGNRDLPQVEGEMQCRLLGCAVEAWNDQGEAVVDAVGELVCVRPMPSMPLYFWGDAGNARYLSSYFDMYPNVWRHGDWLRIGPSGGCVIYGRSDATINRHGLRIGTSELYRAVESLPEVLDSMLVDLEYLGRASYMPLFVVLRDGQSLDAQLRERIQAAIRAMVSPRFLPDAMFQVAEIPRTISGKKQELPVKKLLLGHPAEKVFNRAAMANPQCLDWYLEFAAARSNGGEAG